MGVAGRARLRVSVVIPARDAEATLGDCLDGLAGQDLGEPFEVIVVDNGSRDRTVEIAERHPVVSRVLRRERGEGPGAARNDGAAAAAAPAIAFVDADCAPSTGWLRAGLAALEGADLVQGHVRPPEGAAIGPWDHTLWVTSEYGLYETANLLVRREWLERAGGFVDFVDTRHERPFGEDAWFAWRARRLGARTAFAEGALVHHAVLPGTPREYLTERRREGNFARLVALVPELRDAFLYRRLFLNRRALAFDAAVAGVATAWRLRSPLALLALLPWALLVRGESQRLTGVVSSRVAVVVAAGDAVSFVSRVRSSVAARSPVL